MGTEIEREISVYFLGKVCCPGMCFIEGLDFDDVVCATFGTTLLNALYDPSNMENQ